MKLLFILESNKYNKYNIRNGDSLILSVSRMRRAQTVMEQKVWSIKVKDKILLQLKQVLETWWKAYQNRTGPGPRRAHT